MLLSSSGDRRGGRGPALASHAFSVPGYLVRRGFPFPCALFLLNCLVPVGPVCCGHLGPA